MQKHKKEYRAYDQEQMKHIKQKNKLQTIPELLQRHIDALAQSFNIEPNLIQVILDPEGHDTFRVGRSALYVNSDMLHFYDENLFPKSPYSFKAQETQALLVHEMWHILYQDRYLEWLAQNIFIQSLKNNNHEDLAVYQKLVSDFHLYIEQRCDILAGLSGMLTVLGIISFFETVEKHAKTASWDLDSPVHPKNSERIAYLKKMYFQMREAAGQ